MTGPGHYLEAERLAGLAMEHPSPSAKALWTDLAQVHATLALAAATALVDGYPSQVDAWGQVAGPAPREEPF